MRTSGQRSRNGVTSMHSPDHLDRGDLAASGDDEDDDRDRGHGGRGKAKKMDNSLFRSPSQRDESSREKR